MKIALVKTKYLYCQSYLLVIVPEFIITNSKYDNITLFNRNLDFIRDLPLPIEDTSIHYSYVKSDQKAILFSLSDVNDVLIYFDLTNLKMVVVESKISKFISLSTDYVWRDNMCVIAARDYKTKEDFLLLVDTQKLTARLVSPLQYQKVCSDLFIFLKKKRQCCEVIESSVEKKFLVLADYYDQQTLTFVNTDTDKFRVVSIKKELDEGEVDKKGNYRSKFMPHRICYQDKWVVLLWEERVVIISPNDKRETINKVDIFIFGLVQIISTSEKSIEFIVFLHDGTDARPGLAQIYKVSEE